MPDSVHLDSALSNLLVQQGIGGGFAYERAFPVFPVAKKSDKFFKLYREEIRQDIVTKKSWKDSADKWEWQTTNDDYACEPRKLLGTVYDTDRDNADPVFTGKNSLEEITAMKTQHKIRLDLEKEARTILTDTSTYSNATPSVKWDAASGTIDIFGDIIAAKEAFRKAFGRNPNLMIIEPDVAAVIANDADFLHRKVYTTSNMVETAGTLPPVIAGIKVFVPQSLEDSANPGQSESIDDIWNTDKAMLLYVNPAQQPVLGEPSFGYDIVWQKFGVQGWKVSKWRENNPARLEILAEHGYVFKVVATSGLYIINDTMT